VLPLPARLRRTFGERVGGLPTETRALLVVAAAEATGDPAVVLRAGARLGVDAAALDAAEAAGLVHTGEGRLRFRHPLVRSAAYATATLAGRQAAHRALAEVLAGEHAAAAAALERAAELTGDEAERARRPVAAWLSSSAPCCRGGQRGRGRGAASRCCAGRSPWPGPWRTRAG
jgi:hypothetical protein